MPRFSAFTPMGALSFSGRASRIETIYNAIKANLGGQFSEAKGSHTEASMYARARELARARYVIERVYNNSRAGRSAETLPVHELELGVVPGPEATIPERRSVVAARSLILRGATRTNVSNALAALLGSGFLCYRITSQAEATLDPPTGGASPGSFVPATVTPQLLTVAQAVSVTGSPTTLSYFAFSADAPPVALASGQQIVIEPGQRGRSETVTVSSATDTTFTATFTLTHEPGALVTTGRYPYWLSTKRVSRIVVTSATAKDSEKRRQIHELMKRVARGVSSWDIVPAADATHLAVFTPDDPVLGVPGYAPPGPALTYP
jgi:hypothetical protein